MSAENVVELSRQAIWVMLEVHEITPPAGSAVATARVEIAVWEP